MGPPRSTMSWRTEKNIVNLFVCPPALYISSCGLSQREVEKALQQRGSFHRPMIMCNATQSHSAHSSHYCTVAIASCISTSCTCKHYATDTVVPRSLFSLLHNNWFFYLVTKKSDLPSSSFSVSKTETHR